MTSNCQRKIKIAFLEEDSLIGGAEINVLNLIQKLDKSVFEPIAICPFVGPFTERVKEIGGNVVIIPRYPMFSTSILIKNRKITNPLAILCNLAFFIPSAYKLAKFLRQNKVDVVHTNSMLCHFYGALGARLAQVQCLWHVQDIVDEKQALGLLKWSLNLAGRLLPNRIIVVSQAVKKSLDDKLFDKVKVIYNGTDLRKYRSTNSNEKIRKEFGINPKDSVIGIVGRVVQWKGHKEFLYAAKRISDKDPNVKFLIVGDTSFGKKEFLVELKRLAIEFGLGKTVIFTGFREDVSDLIGAMDICVHASILSDPCPLVVFDYMASGKPVVATDGGGVPEIIRDGITGILVPMRGIESLAKGIIELLEDPVKSTAMGKAGRKRVEEYFPIETFVINMSMQYIDLARRRYNQSH